MTRTDIIPRLVTLISSSKVILNELGNITVIEDEIILGLSPRRLYFINNVPKGTIRGHHAHKELHQLLVCINGSITIDVDDGINMKSVTLDSNKKALYIGPNIWHTMKWNDDLAYLVVLASEVYDEKDYIRNYEDFLNGKKNEDDSF